MFYDNYVRLCNNVSKSPSAVAQELGLSRASVNGWKKGKNPTDATLCKVADYFGVPVEYLLKNYQEKTTALKDGGKNVLILEDAKLVQFPEIGSIAAGYSGLAVETYTGNYALIPFSCLHGDPSSYFVLKVSGDSMYPRILDGDRILVRKTNVVENGKVAVVLYNGDEATVKKVHYQEGKILELIPYNPEYKIKRIEGAELNMCQILGEVVQLIRDM